MSHYSESSPERGYNGRQGDDPSMIRGTTNMTRFGNGFNPVNETNDQVFLKSDGFEQSRYY